MVRGFRKKIRVFIADDSAVVRERLAAMITDFDEIEMAGQAADAPRAIKGIRKLEPDAVILDIRMPGGNGINVLQTIKKIRPATMVIILTNYPYPQYRKKCLENGADFFFDKSTEFEKVTEVLRQLIHDSRA